MRAVWIRHGESTGNAGMPCHDLALIELTERGWRQAREIAAAWSEPPSLIVVSPYLHARQTAEPTVARFPQVPVEIWPIEEFTYLQPSHWNGTRSAERLPAIERYWEAAEPDSRDGEGAESFQDLLVRAGAALARLTEMGEDARVCLFAHGQLIQAVQALATAPGLSAREHMLGFWRKGEPPVIANCARVDLAWDGQRWRSC